MGTMRVMSEHGDLTVTWNPEDEQSTAEAKAEFDRLKGDGYEFFKAGVKRGKKRVTKFEKDLGVLIVAPGAPPRREKTAIPPLPKARPKAAMAGGPNDGPLLGR